MSNFHDNKPGLTIVREFKAPKQLVFEAFASAEAFSQWWGPVGKPISVLHFDFQVGGRTHYAMEGQGQVYWGLFQYKAINKPDSIAFISSFADQEGTICKAPFPFDFPLEIYNEITLTENNGITTLTLQGYPVNPTPAQAATYENMKEGMTQGFGGTLTQLEAYLSAQFKLRQAAHTAKSPRVCVYLNFPGTTEEAFKFYQTAFNGEFTGQGLQRFGDAPLPAGTPPMSEADKKLILHAELTIFPGYSLMATDAPESMGFKVTPGNNMHISIEPSSREETKRLFEALSEGGNVNMPLADMFWGAYYAAFTDKYGINWMLNYIEQV